eukprot:comp8131_c0_seq1/m.3611 comp8131_c0_seq1/g.3611  ORF comp8131_c0_seq1/g.3611 comp8131_c0_seq1/m.3611 type:complete len:207 (-) comp8131_c0_seq1:106-726(-)
MGVCFCGEEVGNNTVSRTASAYAITAAKKAASVTGITSEMEAGGQQQPKTFSQPWIVGVWATLTSIGLIICGIMTTISITPLCWVIGAYIVLVGIITAILEAPLLWRMSNATTRLNAFTTNLRYWHKGLFYFLLVIPVFFCLGVSSIIAAVLILSNGVGYFVLAIGPKGKQQQQQQNAGVGGYARQVDDQASGLAANAVPMGGTNV